MSEELDGTTDSADVAVAQALAKAVREGGRQLASEPRRVQGMVNDVLGAESRTRRSEVDAVVLAAEESIPDDLLSGRIDVDEAVERLHGRGLDGGVALFAVDVWRYALGMLGDDSVPPSLTNSLEATSQPAMTDSMPASVTTSAPEPLVVGVTEVGPEASGVGGPQSVPNGDVDHSEVADGSGRSKTWWLAGSAAALVAVLVVTLVVVAGGGDGSDASEATIARPTTTNATTTVAAPTPAVVDFDAEVTAVGGLERSWAVVDDKVDATLTFTNTSEVSTSGPYFEVVPVAMAASSAAITSPSEFTVMKDVAPQGFKRAVEGTDGYLVLAWNLTVEPGATVDVDYSVAVPAGVEVTSDMLEAWKADQIAAAAEFAVERDTPPALTVTTPNGTVFPTQTVQITGTTDPTATLTLSGSPVAVNPDGTWTMSGDLPQGPSTLDFVAKNTYGTAATVSVSVTVELPAGPVEITSTTTTPPRPPGPSPTTTTPPPPPPGPPPTTTTTTTPPSPSPPPPGPPPTTTTAPPPPPPPPQLTVSISGLSSVVVGCSYVWSASASATASYAWSGMFVTTGSSFTGDVKFAGQFSLTVTATAADGRTASATRTINAAPQNPITPPCQP